MPRSTPDVAGTSIALIGAFDPARAQPSVLLQEGLIRESDFLDLTVQVALPDIMQLHMAWALLTVEKNRIIAATPVTNPAAEPVRDLALDLVSEMKESRVRAIGINSDHHFQALSLDTFHKVGNTLAPKDLWNKLLKDPGMQSLSIIAQRDDGLTGSLSVRVEPSQRIQNGIFVTVNDHFEVTEEYAVDHPHELLKVLADHWTESKQRADAILAAIKGLQTT